MSVSSSFGITVKSSIFNILSVEYPAGGQMNLLLGNQSSSVVRNDCAYINTSYPPESIGGVTGYNMFTVNSDGIYSMTIQLNNDYIGTAGTVCSCLIVLYYYMGNGSWGVAYSNERTYPQADTTNSLNGSVIVDTTVLKSKSFAWNIQPAVEPFTTSASAIYNYQFAQVTMLSPL